jgi:sulfite exporter TauE/SafE
MTSESYIPLLAFSWGLAGGFSHCIGMCGIFVAAYTTPSQTPPSQDAQKPRRNWNFDRHAMFHAGRLASLVTLGVLAGLVGNLDHRWPAVQGVIGIIAGAVMIGLALGFAGIVPWFRIPEPDVLGAGGGRLRRLFAQAMRSQHRLKPMVIGIFVGLLPCGLTYQALIPAAVSGSIVRAALIMALFGLGTVPGLLMLGVFGNALFNGLLTAPRFRNGMTRVAAAIMAVMGVVFIWRGISGM